MICSIQGVGLFNRTSNRLDSTVAARTNWVGLQSESCQCSHFLLGRMRSNYEPLTILLSLIAALAVSYALNYRKMKNPKEIAKLGDGNILFDPFSIRVFP